MSFTLGIDIGTFETKGVLVDAEGRIRAEARHPHRMLVPRPGWAEHRAEEDWWGDFVQVTRAILAQGYPPDQLYALERDPQFVRWLRQNLPAVGVVKACASEVDRVVRPGIPTTIVSSLPFKSMPQAEAQRCASALAAALGGSPGSRLVQNSYGFGGLPPFAAAAELRWAKAGVVLRNVPPATVWTLQRPAADA